MDPKKTNQKTAVIPPIRVTEKEKEDIKIIASNYGLSLSEYMRQAALAQEIRHRTEFTIIRELAKINADLASLGNLLKFVIENGHEDAAIKRLVKDIIYIKNDLKEVVRRI